MWKCKDFFLHFLSKLFMYFYFYLEKEREKKREKNCTNLLIAKVVEWIFEDVFARIWCAR